MLSLTRGKNALPRTTQIANLSNHVLALATFLNLASCACTTAYLARMPEIPGKQVQAIDRAAKTTSKLQAAIAARDIVTDKHHGNRPPPPVLESNLLNHFRPKPDLPYFLLPRDPTSRRIQWWSVAHKVGLARLERSISFRWRIPVRCSRA